MQRIFSFGLAAFSLVFIGTVPCPAAASSDDPDELLMKFANNSELLAEHRGNGGNVRIFRQRDFGECNKPSPDQCPKAMLYIAVSSRDEYPEQKLYKLEPAYGWKFIKWISSPGSLDEQNSFIKFQIERTDMARVSGASANWFWSRQPLDISVNTTLMHVREMKAPCSQTVGAEESALYVQQCLMASPATHPPCNAGNSCGVIISEIARGCVIMRNSSNAHSENTSKEPAFCKYYIPATN